MLSGVIASPPCPSLVCGSGDVVATTGSCLELPTRETEWDQIFMMMILGRLCSQNLQVGSPIAQRDDRKSQS